MHDSCLFFQQNSEIQGDSTMFDLIIREAASRFGLGDKAGPLVQMLIAHISNKDTGGMAGFMAKLTNGGLGGVAQSWLGGGTGAPAVSSSQIESLFGGQGGLLGNITSKLGIGGSTASSALGFLLPAVIGKLTPGGTVPTSPPNNMMGAASGGGGTLTDTAAILAGTAVVATSKVVGTARYAASGPAAAGTEAAGATGGGLMRWWPWLAAGIAALFLLSYFNKGSDAAKQAADGAKSAAASADSAAKANADAAAAAKALVDKAAADADAAAKARDDAAKAAAEAAMKAATPEAAPEAAPVGSGVVSYMADGAPALKVYFDWGKAAVASDFSEKSKDLVEFLKSNASAKALVTGFNDPTGNPAANAELSQNRAKGVASAIKAAGIADSRVLVEKPADPTAGAAKSNAEARRVEVTIRK
jgi:outer membrane protein OmpA-like peptidoglycan-associated protein/uncharacterized protein YidB (DUF937 family)